MNTEMFITDMNSAEKLIISNCVGVDFHDNGMSLRIMYSNRMR